MTKPLDPEIKALRAINRALAPLDAKTRKRALEWRISFDTNRIVTLPQFREVEPTEDSSRKRPCLYPLPDGRRCLECATCQPTPDEQAMEGSSS